MRTLSLVTTLFLGFALLSCSRKETAPLETSHFTIEKLTDGVYAALYKQGGHSICNAGIIDLGDRTAVLDPFMTPAAARDLKAQAEFLTGKPVSLVFNLDPHNDHSSGNQVFVPGAIIISTSNSRKYIAAHFEEELAYYQKTALEELASIQERLPEASGKEKTELLLRKDYQEALIGSFDELKMTLPHAVISDTMTLFGTRRKLVLIPTGTGHTTGDMIAWLPDDRILFLSDQLFVKNHPYLGDGNPAKLRENLEEAIVLNPRVAVPGHGAVGDVGAIREMIGYIDTLTLLVRAEIARGGDETTLRQIPIPEKYEDWQITSFFPVNLTFLYNKLKPPASTQP